MTDKKYTTIRKAIDAKLDKIFILEQTRKQMVDNPTAANVMSIEITKLKKTAIEMLDYI